MSHIKNFLRAYRKKTHITQFDIAFLLELDNNSRLSRYESGERTPGLDVMLAYHLLFDVPVTTLFAYHRNTMRKRLLSVIPQLIEMLKAQESTANVASRMVELEAVLARLKEPAHEN